MKITGLISYIAMTLQTSDLPPVIAVEDATTSVITPIVPGKMIEKVNKISFIYSSYIISPFFKHIDKLTNEELKARKCITALFNQYFSKVDEDVLIIKDLYLGILNGFNQIIDESDKTITISKIKNCLNDVITRMYKLVKKKEKDFLKYINGIIVDVDASKAPVITPATTTSTDESDDKKTFEKLAKLRIFLEICKSKNEEIYKKLKIQISALLCAYEVFSDSNKHYDFEHSIRRINSIGGIDELMNKHSITIDDFVCDLLESPLEKSPVEILMLYCNSIHFLISDEETLKKDSESLKRRKLEEKFKFLKIIPSKTDDLKIFLELLSLDDKIKIFDLFSKEIPDKFKESNIEKMMPIFIVVAIGLLVIDGVFLFIKASALEEEKEG